MKDRLKAIVFYNKEQLRPEDRSNRESRRIFLEERLANLAEQIPSLSLKSPIPPTFSIAVEGSTQAIQELFAFFEGKSDIATVVMDGEVIRTAIES